MSSSYYIYYKVPAAAATRLRAAAEDLQRSVAAKTGIAGRLLCRRDKAETWMEVYEDVGDEQRFEGALNAELERLRFAELLGAGSARVTEIFRPL
jgi:uncharacterized protein DUF4936